MTKRQSSTFTTQSIYGLTRHRKPLTQGRALIDARTSFGPNTHVECRRSERVILSTVGGYIIGDGGKTWEQALASARKEHRGGV